MSKSRVIRVVVLAALLLVSVPFSGDPVVSAAGPRASSTAPGASCTRSQFGMKVSKRNLRVTTSRVAVPKSQASFGGTVAASIGEEVSDQLTVGGGLDLNATYEWLTATLSFNVQKSWSQTVTSGSQYSYVIPPGKYGRVVFVEFRVGGVFAYEQCVNESGPWGTGMTNTPFKGRWRTLQGGFSFVDQKRSFWTHQVADRVSGPWTPAVWR